MRGKAGMLGANRERGWNIIYALSLGTETKSISSQTSAPTGLTFKPDGTTMYVTGSSPDSIFEYGLASPWDVSTASYTREKSVGTQDATPQGLAFKPDGSSMYLVGSAGDAVYQYSLSTPWNISSATFNLSKSLSSQDSIPTGIAFKPDGTKMYVSGDGGNSVYEYDLPTPWSVFTASYVQSFSVSARDITPRDLFFKFDGSRMYVVGAENERVYEYALSTEWDISTASYVQFKGIARNPQGLFFKPDGLKMFVVGANGDAVYSYSVVG